MKATGHQLKESLKFHQLRLSAMKGHFDKSLYAFEDEEKPSPHQIDQDVFEVERTIARVQTAQAWYNLNVNVVAGQETITLMEAIKAIGGAGRRESRWRSACTPRKDPYSFGNKSIPTRNDNEIAAKAMVTFAKALEQATEAARFAAQLRSGIAQGNMTEQELPDHLLRVDDLV